MSRIPHAREVDRVFRTLRKELKLALKQLNAVASKSMAKGDYASAESLALKGRELREFQAEVDALIQRWRAVRERVTSTAKGGATPQWAYYQPVLQALVQCGGEGTARDIEPIVFRQMGAQLEGRDRQRLAGGRERWQLMIARTRKLMVAEGWLEDEKGKTWRITEEGRLAATAIHGDASTA
jgi:hypothetical protein